MNEQGATVSMAVAVGRIAGLKALIATKDAEIARLRRLLDRSTADFMALASEADRLREALADRERRHRDDVERLTRERDAWRDSAQAYERDLMAQDAEIARLRATLVTAALPLEAMRIGGSDRLHTPEVQRAIADAVTAIRAALASSGE